MNLASDEVHRPPEIMSQHLHEGPRAQALLKSPGQNLVL